MTSGKSSNYNFFTIKYIETIKDNLKIDLDSSGTASFYPDRVDSEDILNLRKDLERIWDKSESAISLIKQKHDTKIQLGLFGLVNDLDTALKVGFMLGDRIILIDYLFDRLLRKDPNKIDYTHLGVITSSLVNLLPLAERGRVVIIPNPFKWHADSKQILEELSSKTILTPNLMSLLNMLSITKVCQLHPYTISESEDEYLSIINQIDYSDTIGPDAATYAYEGILGALLTERILDKTELKTALNIPISKYYEIISYNKDFYNEYLNILTQGGSLNSQQNIEKIKDKIQLAIDQNENEIKSKLKKGIEIGGNLTGGMIGILGAATVISAPIAICGAILGFLPTLTSLLETKDISEQPLISVFKKMLNE